MPERHAARERLAAPARCAPRPCWNNHGPPVAARQQADHGYSSMGAARSAPAPRAAPAQRAAPASRPSGGGGFGGGGARPSGGGGGGGRPSGGGGGGRGGR